MSYYDSNNNENNKNQNQQAINLSDSDDDGFDDAEFNDDLGSDRGGGLNLGQ